MHKTLEMCQMRDSCLNVIELKMLNINFSVFYILCYEKREIVFWREIWTWTLLRAERKSIEDKMGDWMSDIGFRTKQIANKMILTEANFLFHRIVWIEIT